jgi:ATP-dependent Clp protease ATP-binding subunit ClpC
MTETNLVAAIGLTARAAKVVTQVAAEVARREGHDYVGTEHLLVALIEERDGLASQVLYLQGVAESVREAALDVIRSPEEPPT